MWTGRLRFIEVKGRVRGATTVTVTKNEILTALNKPDDFILTVVEAEGELGYHATSEGLLGVRRISGWQASPTRW